jgi:hypothetical protein
MHDPGVHDSDRATRGTDVPALLVSPSGCVGATGTASTSAVADDEGRTGGTYGQPSSDDHVSKAGLLATGRQTHPVGHFGVDLVAGALYHLRHPRRSELAPHHGRRICCRAMEEEFAALIASNTWNLLPRPVGSNVITGK